MTGTETIRHAALDLAINGAADFKKSMGEINRELKASQAELNKVTAAYGKNEQNIETLSACKNHLNNAIESNRKEQQLLNEELQRATEQYGENSREAQVLATKVANAEAKGIGLARQLGEVTAALEEQERALRGQSWTEFGQKMEAAGERMQAAGQRMQDTGRTLSMAVTAPIMAVGAAAIAVGADYERSMNTIRANTNMTAEEMEKLSSSFRAMALSGDYGIFTAREIAAAYSNVALAGHDAEHATELMRTAMVLATAVGDDLANTAYFLGGYLDKIGKDASYAEKYINLFADANQRTGIGLNTLQDYLFRANASLQAASISGTEATAIFSQLYQSGIRGANAYSGFSQAIQSIMLPSNNARDALEELGIANSDYYVSQGRTLDLLFKVTEALEGVEDSTHSLDLMTTIFTQGSAQAFIDGLGDNRDALQGMIVELYEASGALDGTGIAFERAGKNQEGLIGSGKQLRASMEEVKLQIADHLMPHALRLTEGLGNLVQRFASLDEGTQRTIITLAGVAAAAGPVLLIGGKLVTTAGKITTGFGKMATTIGLAGGAKDYFTAKFPILTKATTAYTTANAKLMATMKGTTVATTASTKAFSLKATAMTGFTKVTTTVTGGLTAMKAGFIKLKAVVLANPLGVAVVGVAALAGGIAVLITRVRRVSDEYQEMQEETARLTSRQNELAEASANAAAQFKTNQSEMRDQNQHLRQLADSIKYLTSKQELSAGEMEMLERYMIQLNDSVPGLTLAIDEQTGSLNMSIEALNSYLAAAEKRAALDAQIEEQMRLEQEAISLQREAIAVAEERAALEEQLNDGTRRRRADKRALEDAIAELTEAEVGYSVALAANADIQDVLTQSIETYSQALLDLEQTQRETAESAQAIADSMDEAASSVDGASDAMTRHGHTLEEWERAHDDAIEKINQSYERYYRIAASAFRTVSEAAAVSVQELTQNLQDNAQAVEEWSKNIVILTERGVDQGLIQQLRDAGPEAAATVRELVDATDEELDALNDAFQTSTRIAMESMQRELDPASVTQSADELIYKVADAILSNQSMEDALVGQINNAFDSLSDSVDTLGFGNIGMNALLGFTDGIKSRQDDVKKAGEDTGASLLDGLKDELDMSSPSRATYDIAVYAGEGIIKGTQDIESKVVQAAIGLARAFICNIADTISQNQDIDNSIRRQVEDIRRVADMTVQSSNFESVGFEISQGVARGIQNGGGIVSNAAQNMINNALSAMRAAAAIASPSRKAMKIADQIGDGLIIRMKAKGKELVKVCEGITKEVMKSFHVAPSDLMKTAQSIQHDMKTNLPAMQHYAKQVTWSHPVASAQPPPLSIVVDMTRGKYYVREDADIDKIAEAVEKKLLRKLDYESRIRG